MIDFQEVKKVVEEARELAEKVGRIEGFAAILAAHQKIKEEQSVEFELKRYSDDYKRGWNDAMEEFRMAIREEAEKIKEGEEK